MADIFTQAFNSSFFNIGNNVIKPQSDTFKLMLLTAGYAFNPAHEDLSSVSSYQIAAGNGYVAGGITLTGTSWVQGSGIAKLNANDITMTATGVIPTFTNAVVYSSTASKLLLHLNFVDPIDMVNTDQFFIDVTADGIFNVAWGV